MTVVTASERHLVSFVTATRIYGGLDASSPEVLVCERNHGKHKWTGFAVEAHGDLPPFDVVICGRCCVRQCNSEVKRSDPFSICVLPTGHTVRPHRDEAGYWRAVS